MKRLLFLNIFISLFVSFAVAAEPDTTSARIYFPFQGYKLTQKAKIILLSQGRTFMCGHAIAKLVYVAIGSSISQSFKRLFVCVSTLYWSQLACSRSGVEAQDFLNQQILLRNY
jgi:hypothetical protein